MEQKISKLQADLNVEKAAHIAAQQATSAKNSALAVTEKVY